MAGRTPIPVSHAMRAISSNLDLARRQQRITVELLANRANLSVPTVRKMLNEGSGSFENFLRIARLLGFLDGVVEATDPLRTGIGRIRAEEDVPKRVRLS
ncbi:MAG: transcriptional regulator [Parafannyhessea sp.]|uniref:transcriptional regulator n=1 Tax=Parafannyhessea sp. TaxID=2847324 RepID=UPI003F0EA5C2